MRKSKGIFNLIIRCAHNKRKFPLDPNHHKEIPVTQYVVTPHKRNRVYVWGNVRTGALGIPYLRQKETVQRIEKLHNPKRLHFAEINNVTTIGCGFGFTLFGVNTPEGDKVFGTGLNTDSQIGYHAVRANRPMGVIFLPQELSLPLEQGTRKKVLKISAGRAHSAILTDKGLFMSGSNCYGQCGRPVVENENYSLSNFVNLIDNVDGKQIVDVECGQDHTMIIDEEGSVYSCGWGADGQTGLGHYNSESKFTKVNGDITGEKIKKLSCRSDFVLALSEKEEVFGWGNVEYAQMITPNGEQQICDPMFMQSLKNIGKVKDIATGGCSCIILTESRQVFVWGFGLLGTGPNVNESKMPIEIPPRLFGINDFNPNSKVEKVSAGLSHMAAVTQTGDLYTWGRNRNCCLGQGHENDQYFPLKVAVGAEVKEVYCSLDHTIVLCKSFLSESV